MTDKQPPQPPKKRKPPRKYPKDWTPPHSTRNGPRAGDGHGPRALRSMLNGTEALRTGVPPPPREMTTFDLSRSGEVFELLSSALASYFMQEMTKDEAEMVRRYAETAFRGQGLGQDTPREIKDVLRRLARPQPAESPPVMDAEVTEPPGE